MSWQPTTVPYVLQTSTFTGVGSGAPISLSGAPMMHYAIYVTADSTPASWDIRLEGSLDGINFTSILAHTGVVGINVTMSSKADVFPTFWIRSRVSALVLGPATSITVVILGVQ